MRDFFLNPWVVMLMVGIVIPAGSLGAVCLFYWVKDKALAAIRKRGTRPTRG